MLFFQYVLGINEANLQLSRIELEEPTNNGRRVDIVIHCGKNVYPVEVKIWARDRQLQLSDYYYNYFKNKEGRIYYLTPDGHKPSETSTGSLDPSFIQCISFDELSQWLNVLCSCDNFTQKDICRQFLAFVNDIKERYKMSDNVIAKIFEEKNTENITSALAIIEEKDNILKKIKDDYLFKLKKIIETIEYSGTKYLCDYADNTDEDKFRCLKIYMDNDDKRTLYYICIDHNLYITLGDNSEENVNWKDLKWEYIDIDGRHFNFKHPGRNVVEFAYDRNEDLTDKMKKTLENLMSVNTQMLPE